MEIRELYRDEYVKTGEKIFRGDAIPDARYAMIIFVCIFDQEGRMLIQRRQLTKKSWAGLWDVSVGGSVMEGEDSRQAAIREVKEELGIDLPADELVKVFSLYYENTIHDIYSVVCNLGIEEITLQEEEVMDARYASREEIITMIDREEFIPVQEEFISLLFRMKNRKGIMK